MAKKWVVAVGFSAAVLAGCATPPAPANLESQSDWLLKKIDASASRVADAQADIARMSAAQNPAMIPKGPPDGVKLPVELQRSIYLHWQGPVHDVVASIGRMIDYRVSVIGVPSPNPVIVDINTDAESVFDVLQSIGLQCGDRAGVLIDPAARKISLVWAPKTAAPAGAKGRSW
ncbi:MAG: DotD/TraH family lipoprotein [Burkholderiales bacterium]|nr:DotD/TraH family lipoprotein [Burkholderiales bacterium]